jgi:hypothetical protein
MSDLACAFHDGDASDEDLIQEIELLGSYLNLKTIAAKAKEMNTDYNNIKKSSLKKVEMFGVKFVIDND